MKLSFLFMALIWAFPSSAMAGVSDSGDLNIGGQGIIQGTMSVIGSAFSVGGATFSVAGGSVTLGGQLNLPAAGIKWADGSTSTTASSGSGGGSLIISTATGVNNPVDVINAWTGITGSSLSLTASAGQRAFLFANAALRLAVSGGTSCYMRAVRDADSLVPPGSTGHCLVSAGVTNLRGDCGFTLVTNTLTAATHSFWLEFKGTNCVVVGDEAAWSFNEYLIV